MFMNPQNACEPPEPEMVSFTDLSRSLESRANAQMSVYLVTKRSRQSQKGARLPNTGTVFAQLAAFSRGMLALPPKPALHLSHHRDPFRVVQAA